MILIILASLILGFLLFRSGIETGGNLIFDSLKKYLQTLDGNDKDLRIKLTTIKEMIEFLKKDLNNV